MKAKRLTALFCVAALITACGCGNNKGADIKPSDKSAYRNVKVIGVSGTATLTRESKEQDVYAQMLVNSGDNIVTQEKSTVDLSLDSDKYAQIYENSDVSFKLEGNTSKGAIRIYLNKGGINNKIENKLSSKDSYEVHTPDAVMAVRGTEFEVITQTNESGRKTTVITSNGSVEITLKNQDGDEKLNNSGETTVIETPFNEDGSTGDPEFSNEISESDTSESSVEDNSQAENSNTPDRTTSKKEESQESTKKGTATSTTQAGSKKNICPKCRNTLQSGKSHILSCGSGHYSCDGKNHSVCKDCQKNLCTHKAYKCGKHYPCSPDIYDGHYAQPCGHYLCSMIDDSETVIHEKCVTCGTYGCKTNKAHYWADCGCISCKTELGDDHIICDACYSCKSDGKKHGACEYCYGCISDGKTHGDGVCNENF